MKEAGAAEPVRIFGMKGKPKRKLKLHQPLRALCAVCCMLKLFALRSEVRPDSCYSPRFPVARVSTLCLSLPC